MIRLDVDFNQIDEQGRIWVPAAEAFPIKRGEWVVLSDGEIEVPATLGYDEARRTWVGSPDQDRLRFVGRVEPLPTVG